jgi:uncharacterized protein with gpF-like domain
MEEDIIKGANEYYHLADKYDKKINNIVNRYEIRTNKLFIDLRNREVEHRKLCNKVDSLIRRTTERTAYHYEDIDDMYRYTAYSLYIYTFFVITMLFNSVFSIP